jgi:hypothetical protein
LRMTEMDEELLKKARAELARQGGYARAKALSATERTKIAIKAAKAAAKKRTQEAKRRKAERERR